MRTLMAGMDLHGNNVMVAIVDADGARLQHRRLGCDLVRIPTKSDTQSDPYRTACRFISDSCRSEATLGGDL
jgi:hypothetical protein